MRTTAFLFLPLGLAALASGLQADPPVASSRDRTMSFRNNLLAGHLTEHELSRTVRRESHRRDHVERLTYQQKARWVQCNIEENRPGSVMVYQMMVDHPAEVVGLRHGKKKVSPLPPPAEFGLPGGTTRLLSVYRTAQDSPAQVPLADPAQRAVLGALLDVAHWPRERVEIGRSWTRELRGGGLVGRQTCTFLDFVKLEGEVIARVALEVEGAFEEPLDREYVFKTARATIAWSRPERTLVKLEGAAEFQRLRANAPEVFKLTVNLDLKRRELISEAGQEVIKDQMIAFAEALQKDREGARSRVVELCRAWRNRWPKSIWLPAVMELEARASARPARAERMTEEQISELLTRTVLTFEAARDNYEYDLLERTGRELVELTREQGDLLHRLVASPEPGRRGRAAFALSFSERAEDRRLVERAVRDDADAVRALALAGLAARGHPDTSAELLVIMLEDRAPAVRAKACQAVSACLSPEHLLAGKAAERLHHLLVHDESPAVRREAVRAVGSIGGSADIPLLEKALTYELNHEIREDLDRAIERLRARE